MARKYPIVFEDNVISVDKPLTVFNYLWYENDRVFLYDEDNGEIAVKFPKNIQSFVTRAVNKNVEIFTTKNLIEFPHSRERLTYNSLMDFDQYAYSENFDDENIYNDYGKIYTGITPDRIFTHQATVNPTDLIYYGSRNRKTLEKNFVHNDTWPIFGVYSKKLSGWVIFNGNHRTHLAQIFGIPLDIYSIDYEPYTKTLDKIVLKDYRIFNPYKLWRVDIHERYSVDWGCDLSL